MKERWGGVVRPGVDDLDNRKVGGWGRERVADCGGGWVGCFGCGVGGGEIGVGGGGWGDVGG